MSTKPDQPNPPGKPGRPKGSTTNKVRKFKNQAERLEYEAAQKADIVARQKHDCKELATGLKKARPGALTPADMQKLVNATATLHGLEREAHDFGAKGQDTQSIMLIPVPAETMAQWDVLSKAIIPRHEAPSGLKVVNTNVSHEEEIIGQPEDSQEPADPATDAGPQAPGGRSA